MARAAGRPSRRSHVGPSRRGHVSEETSNGWLKFNELEAEIFGFGAKFGEGLGAAGRTVLIVAGGVVEAEPKGSCLDS